MKQVQYGKIYRLLNKPQCFVIGGPLPLSCVNHTAMLVHSQCFTECRILYSVKHPPIRTLHFNIVATPPN